MTDFYGNTIIDPDAADRALERLEKEQAKHYYMGLDLAKGYMTGQEWYERFKDELSLRYNKPLFDQLELILTIAKRASGVAEEPPTPNQSDINNIIATDPNDPEDGRDYDDDEIWGD